MKRWLFWAPFATFGLLFAVVASGLFKPADRTVRSALVGKALPDFVLPPIAPGKAGLTTATFRQGQPRLLNIFASWCIPCAAESPQLLRLKAMGVPVDAIAIRDTAPALRAFLRRNGDPYARIGADAHSRVQLALGSSGVPETFVIDGKGVIRAQHVGDIRAEDVPALLQALADAK